MTTHSSTPEKPQVPLADTQEFVEIFAAAELETDTFEVPTFSPPPTPAPAEKTKISMLGGFRLTSILGEGGMGRVYKAQQLNSNQFVALKVMSKQTASKPGFIQRFRREVRILGRLNHPNIVRYLAAGESHGFIYLAMELVDGGSLAHWLEKTGPMSLGDALHIARACATALQYAHELNLVHRDIKPDNLLLSTAGEVKLADLGLARTTDDSDMSCTRTGTGIGTPLYAPPEQARDAKRVDARSDLYALGGVLYHCLTGQPPFQFTNLVEMIVVKEKGKFPHASEINPKVPANLDRILAKLLENAPELRFQSAAELIHDLDRMNLASEQLSFLKV